MFTLFGDAAPIGPANAIRTRMAASIATIACIRRFMIGMADSALFWRSSGLGSRNRHCHALLRQGMPRPLGVRRGIPLTEDSGWRPGVATPALDAPGFGHF